MIATLDAFAERVAAVVKVVAGALLVVVTAAMVAVILGRHIGFVTAWADEVARIAFIWSVCLGAASATRHGLHFAIVLFAGARDGRMARAREALIVVVMIALCGLLAWATTQSLPVASLARLPALGVSGVWFHAPITVFAALAAFFLLAKLAALGRAR